MLWYNISFNWAHYDMLYVLRELHIRVERRRDPMTGDYFENIGGMLFKDGFLYKTVSMKSISSQNIKPTFDELEKFRQPGENGDSDMASLSTLFANRKKGHFLKGDAVIVVKGDLKNLKGWVEKVEEENVHIRPEMKDLPVRNNSIATNSFLISRPKKLYKMCLLIYAHYQSLYLLMDGMLCRQLLL